MKVPAIDPRFWTYLPFFLLAVAIPIGVTMAYRVWRDLHADEEPVSDTDLFSDLEKAYVEGKMSEAEFRRIRAKLIGIPGKGAEKVQAVPPRDLRGDGGRMSQGPGDPDDPDPDGSPRPADPAPEA